MNIIYNGQPIQIGESTTFLELFQQIRIPDLNGKIICKNNQPLAISNYNCQVKAYFQANDYFSIQPSVPYRPIMNTTPNFQSPDLNQIPNQQFKATNVGFQQGVNPLPNQQFNIQPGQQQKIQGSQPYNQSLQQNNQAFNQQFNQLLQQNNQQFSQSLQSLQPLQPPNQTFNPQSNQQTYPQQSKIQVIPNSQPINVPANNEAVDVFATAYQNQNYDEQRQNYLRNKYINPGIKQVSSVIDGYRFTLDNYGDELIIEKTDQSFWFRLNSSYKMNKQKRQSTPQSTSQFESNVRLDLNYTRVAWIQNQDLLAVQFNTGDKVFMNLYME